MRLSAAQRSAILQAFNATFCLGDTLWLFGSRTDTSKKGGDIDLFIETNESDSAIILKRKIAFLGALQAKLGEQKIDIVIQNPGSDCSQLIYQEVHKRRIKLMRKQSQLETYIESLDTHEKRLSWALGKIAPLTPISAEEIANLSDEQVAFLEQVYSRFCKMQDEIGTKVFPEVLNYTDTKAISFIDKVNAMEKLEFLADAAWWTELRDLRNILTHEYENNYPTHADNTNELVVKAKELLDYWKELKVKLKPFILS